MRLTVQRKTYTPESTQGVLAVDDAPFCYTLEPRRDQALGKPYCVPPGTYPIALGYSVHFQMTVPRVNDVPDFTGVEIHPGNYPRDTHGCCLVGETESSDFVGGSRYAFDRLIAMLLHDVGPNTITYVE